MKLSRKAQIGYNGVWVVIMCIFIVAITGLTAGGAMLNSAQANSISDVNQTNIATLTPYGKLNTTLSDMKTSFIDEDGNAKTGTTNVINALYTGIAGLIAVIFQSVTAFVPIINQIGAIMHLPSEIVGIGILFMVLVAVVAVTYMIRRI